MLSIDPGSVKLSALPSLPLADRRQLPNCAAVYLVLEGENVIYVGQSTSLILRWQGHDKLKQLKSRGAEIRLAWLECNDPTLLRSIEAALIQWFKPELNRFYPKLKQPHLTSEKTGIKKRIKRYAHNKNTGKFCSPNPEPLAKRIISVRLPVSIDSRVRELAGNELSEWIRQAIAEKLAREDNAKST